MWPALISGGMGIAQAFMNKGGKASSNYTPLNLPSYDSSKSQYDAPATGQLYNFYSQRAAGNNVGYSPDDMGTMTAQAQDNATAEGEELQRRGMAGRQLTGGMSTGGTNSLREKSIGQTLASRSNAMREINISNAVLKRQEIENAGQGLQNFDNSERAQQANAANYGLYKGALENNSMNAGAASQAGANSANNKTNSSFINSLFSSGGQIGQALLAKLFPQGQNNADDGAGINWSDL